MTFTGKNLLLYAVGGAEGVHSGQDEGDVAEVRKIAGNRLIIGVSAHNVKEALAAKKMGLITRVL